MHDLDPLQNGILRGGPFDGQTISVNGQTNAIPPEHLWLMPEESGFRVPGQEFGSRTPEYIVYTLRGIDPNSTRWVYEAS